MAFNQIQPYIYDPESDPEAAVEQEQQQKRLEQDVSMWYKLYTNYIICLAACVIYIFILELYRRIFVFEGVHVGSAVVHVCVCVYAWFV